MTKVIAVIIARQGSSRLPGKALKLIQNKPIIGLMIERIKACKLISEVLIATSTNKEDDDLETYGKSIGTHVFRGHPEDVLDRLYHATKNYDADLIIEIGGDCPFVGPQLLESGINHFMQQKADVVSNALLPPYTAPNGYDFISITPKALYETHHNAVLKSERFQPFQYIVRNAKAFTTFSFQLNNNYNYWRWTLDYQEDFDFVKTVYDELYPVNPLFEFNEIKSLLELKPEIAQINAKHHDPIIEYGAWSTGSYVNEMHEDIAHLLNLAKASEASKDFEKALRYYEKIQGFNNELIARAQSKLGIKNSFL